MGKFLIVVILVLIGYLSWLFYFKDHGLPLPTSLTKVLPAGILSSSSDKWYLTMSEAKESAKSRKKPILVVFIIGDGYAALSTQFDNQILADKGFKDYVAKRYVLLRMDYSPLKIRTNSDATNQEMDQTAMFNSVTRYPQVIVLNDKAVKIASLGYNVSDPWAASAEAFAKELESRVAGQPGIPEFKDALPGGNTSGSSASSAPTSPGKISISDMSEPAAPAPSTASAPAEPQPAPAAAPTPPPAPPEPSTASTPAPAPSEPSAPAPAPEKPAIIMEGYEPAK